MNVNPLPIMISVCLRWKYMNQQTTPPQLRGGVGMCGNKVKKEGKKRNKIEQKNSAPGTSSTGSQATAAVAEFTAVPPPLSNHHEQQHS